MAYIEKRKQKSGKVSYRARVRQAGSPDVSQSFNTRREATNWSQRMEAEIRAGRYFGRDESKEKTFADFADRYIEKELPKNPKAFQKQKMMMSWWKSHLSAYYLCHITPSMIAELRDKLLSESTCRHKLRTPSTTNRYLAALSRAFTIAVKEWQWIKENPLLRIQRPKENKAKDRYLEKDEITQLLAACQMSKSIHLYGVVSCLLATGARKGEVLGLKIGDVDFHRATATFRDTKNGDTRTVHLNSKVLNILRTSKEKRVVMSEYLFPSVDGKKPADIRGAWESAVKEAGLNNISLHTLRHTVASHLSMNGFSILEIGNILGHKSMSMVKRYSHLSTASSARLLNKLNDEILGQLDYG
jgi:integrase